MCYVIVFRFRRLPCSMQSGGASVSLVFWSHNSQLFPQQLLFCFVLATLRDRREQITDICVLSEFLKMYFHVVFHVLFFFFFFLTRKLLAGDSAANVKLAVFSTSLTAEEHAFPPRRDRTRQDTKLMLTFSQSTGDWQRLTANVTLTPFLSATVFRVYSERPHAASQ